MPRPPMLRPVELPARLIGQALPWDVYADNGVLVASRGTLISDAAHHARLCARPLFRGVDGAEADDPQRDFNPLDRLRVLAREADALLYPPYSALLPSQIDTLADALRAALRADPDACFGYLRLARLGRPSVQHAMLVMLTSLLLADSLECDEPAQASLANAALTMNLAAQTLHDRLALQSGAPGASERAALNRHPEESAEALRALGVADEAWLDAIRQHHENMDGSGYPAGLPGDRLSLAARILRVADTYCAKISSRHYRPALSAQAALRDLFGRNRAQLDAQVCARLLRTLGQMPPGTLLRLANGETACVTRREHRGPPRHAYSFMDSQMRPLNPPPARDLQQRAFAVRGLQHPEAHWPDIAWQGLWGYD